MVGLFGVEPVAGEGAGEIVAAKDVALEAAVAAFFLGGFEGVGVGSQSGDGFRLGRWQAEPCAEHDLLGGREVDADEGTAGLEAEVGILQVGKERRIEVTEAGG